MAPTRPTPLTTTTAALVLLLAAGSVSARTDIAGCVSTMVSSNSVVWYVPGTGELCEFLDCGGGRAPPKTTVPGCPMYEGTETVTPKIWDGFKTSTSEVVEASTTVPATASSASGPVSTGVMVTGAGGEGEEATTTTMATGIETKGSASESGSGSAASSTASTGGAMPTGAARVFGAVAGVAVAGLVIA